MRYLSLLFHKSIDTRSKTWRALRAVCVHLKQAVLFLYSVYAFSGVFLTGLFLFLFEFPFVVLLIAMFLLPFLVYVIGMYLTLLPLSVVMFCLFLFAVVEKGYWKYLFYFLVFTVVWGFFSVLLL